jgi:hypothetical protein
MTKLIIGFIGVLVFVSSVYLYTNVQNGEKLASTLDNEETSYGVIDGELLPCAWDVHEPSRVMSENTSQTIIVNINDQTTEGCQAVLSLRAPSFDMSPMKEEQKITLPKNGNGSMSWIISPRKVGTFEITVSDSLNTKVYGVNVTNMFGLSAVQAQVASVAGTLFGPMLTVPWWWERLRQRKQKQSTQKEGQETTNKQV